MTDPALPAVGFIGLGNMGWPMARHLAAAGVRLTVSDAVPSRAATFVSEHGGRVASGPADLARDVSVVITMLPDGHAVRAVALGTADAPGVIAAMAADAIMVDMGSSDPAIYPELAAALAGRGAHLVDAPVSGAVTGAAAASLTIMAGGDPATVDRVAPLFEIMGQRLFRTGALGSGQAMKALNNLVSAGCFLVTLEALMTGQRFGLDPALMTEVLNVSTGRNNSTDKKIGPHVLSRRFDSGFALKLMAKDLATAGSIATATATPTTISAVTVQAVQDALALLGDAADHTALARWVETRVGDELQAASPDGG